MKNFAGLFLVLLISVQTEAQIKKTYQRVKQYVTGSAKLAQLHYFPEQWEVDLNVGYRYELLEVKGNSTGITVVEADQKLSLLKGSVTLGVLDNVYTQLNWDYLVAQDIKYSKPTNQPSTKYKGVADPTIAAVVRLLNAESFKLDVKGAFQPSLGDQEEADGTHDGNAKAGGHVITLGGRAVALITNSSQISAKLDYKMLSLANSVDLATQEVSEKAKHNETVIELATLTELKPDFYFGLLLEINNAESFKTKNLTTLSETNNGTLSSKALNAVGKFEMTPDSLVEVQLGYLIDYSTTTNSVDVSADGYSLVANYLIRF